MASESSEGRTLRASIKNLPTARLAFDGSDGFDLAASTYFCTRSTMANVSAIDDLNESRSEAIVVLLLDESLAAVMASTIRC